MRCIAVYGAGGCGREIMPLARAQYRDGDTDFVFIDDGMADGKHILSFDAFLDLPHEEKCVTLGIANSNIRENLAVKCSEAGLGVIDIRADNVIILEDIQIDEGAVLCSFTHLTCDIRIGKHFHANFYSYVAHDCVIGDYVTFAPAVKCNGNVHIDDHAYIGAGAVLRQGSPGKPLRIGRGAVVGMGAVVTRDIPAGETWVGNPARLLRR